MMDKKIIFVLVAALCAYQLTDAGSVSPKNIIDDTLAWAQQQVADWIAGVQQLIADEIARIEAIIQGYIDLAYQILYDATAELRAMIVKIQNIIREAEEQAAAVGGGTDISLCITGQEDRANAIINDAITGVATCLTSKIGEAQAIVVDLIQQGDDALHLVPVTLGNLQDCLSKPTLTEVACIYHQIDVFQAEGDRIVAAIKDDVAKADVLFTTLGASLQECATSRIQEAGAAIDQLGEDIVLCVAGMLIPGGKQ